MSENCSEDKLMILLGLFRLRCAEFGMAYCALRQFQKNVEEDTWIHAFLKELAVAKYYHVHVNHWTCEENPKKKRKLVDQAKAISDCRFGSVFCVPYDGIQEELIDLKMALTLFFANPSGLIARLDEFQAFGILQKPIKKLLREYKIMNYCLGSPTSLFNFFRMDEYNFSLFRIAMVKDGLRGSFNRISKIWYEILMYFKTYLICLSQGISKGEVIHTEIIKEIDLFIKIYNDLDFVLASENDGQLRGFIGGDEWRNAEKVFIDGIETNPFLKY